MQLVRKITRDTVFGGKEAVIELVLKDKEKTHTLFTVYGVCRGFRDMPAKGEMKASMALIGEFRAINAEGEHFASGVVYVPQYLADIVRGALGDENEGVQFAFEITAKYDSASATSYVYGAKVIGETKESDPLREIESKVTSHLGQKMIGKEPTAEEPQAEAKGRKR